MTIITVALVAVRGSRIVPWTAAELARVSMTIALAFIVVTIARAHTSTVVNCAGDIISNCPKRGRVGDCLRISPRVGR